MKITVVWLSCVYTSLVSVNVPMQNSVFLYDTWHIQLLQEVHLANSTGCMLYQQTLDMFCLAMPLDCISEDTLSITGTNWSAKNLMLIPDVPLYYVMAGVWGVMSATTIHRAMCVRWVCKVKKPIPAPSWNMSKHLILNTFQRTTLCGPQLMENWKAAASDKWYWQDKIIILHILTLPLILQVVALKMFSPRKL
jgi:hypothetical protein